jgi:hypothetical protein
MNTTGFFLRRKGLFHLAGLLACAGFMVAAEARADAPVTVSARFQCLSLEGPISGLAMMRAEGKPLAITVPDTFLSPVYEYKGPADVVLIDPSAPSVTPGPVQAGKAPQEPRPLATFTLPPEGGRFLLIFRRSATYGYDVAPVVFSQQAMPAGSYLLINLSTRDLGLQLGPDRVMMTSGSRQVLTSRATPGTHVDLAIYDAFKGNPRLVYSGAYFHPVHARQILFFADNPRRSGDVLLTQIRDMVTEEKPAGTQSAGL